MSEVSSYIPDTVIQDKNVAWDMAHTQKPFWEVEKHMNAIGDTETANKVAIEGLAAVAKLEQRSIPSNKVVSQVATPENNPEEHEKIVKSTTLESVAVFDMWFSGEQSPSKYRHGSRGVITDVFTNPGSLMKAREKINGVWTGFMPTGFQGRMRDDLAKKFDDNGISEAVFVSPELPRLAFGKINPDTKYKDDPAVVIRYQDVAKSDGKFAYQGGGRGGNHIKAQIILPKTIADQLSDEIQENPGTIREVVTKIMQDRIQADEDWDASRPPYEKWDEINDGTNRLIFSGPDTKGPGGSIILQWGVQIPLTTLSYKDLI